VTIAGGQSPIGNDSLEEIDEDADSQEDDTYFFEGESSEEGDENTIKGAA